MRPWRFVFGVVMAGLAGGWGSTALAGEVRSIASETKPVAIQRKAEAMAPVSIRNRMKDIGAAVKFPALDLIPIQAEDGRQDGWGKPLRIGVFREVPAEEGGAKVKSRQGEWVELPGGGQVWRWTVESPGAIGIRVHLADVSLPEGVEIAVFAAGDPVQMRGPYGKSSIGGRGEFWTGTVFAERVTVEVYCPPGVAVDGMALKADRIIHIYRDPVAEAKEGSCHNDVACHAAWVSTGNGVAGIGTVGESGFLWCTGCLLNDQEPATFIDYFMTANHCVANQSEASDTEFYWFYQVSACNGTPPNLASVTTTDGGATYLAGRTFSQANDFAFLRLNTAAPGGATYAGWSVNTPSASETLAGIHHPDGSYKRISFGKLDFSDVNYWDVQWSSGVTEPGSSGSPLFNASKQFIGQLYGGYSTCSDPDGIDSYGRFSVSYPLIQSWLGAPTLALSPTGRVHSSAAATGQTVTVSGGASWTATDDRDWIVITSGASGSGSGVVTYRITANAGAVRTGTITVAGGGLTRTFTVTQLDGDIYEEDNASSTAKSIGNTQWQNRSIHRAGDVDWVKFVVKGIGARNAVLETSGAGGDTEMWLYKGSSGALLAHDDDSGNGDFARIAVASLQTGTHFLKIQEAGNNGTISAYALRANWATQYAPDAYEVDNHASQARSIANGQTQSRSIHVAGDMDWAKIWIGGNGARNLVVETRGTSGDTKMRMIRGSTGRRVGYDDNSGAGSFSRITIPSIARGTYYIRVQEASNDRILPAYTLKASWIAR